MIIYKYPIKIVDEQTVMMSRGARILCVQTQHDDPYIWAWIPDENTKVYEPRKIKIVGTGNPFEGDGRHTYIGTFQTLGHAFVGHVFESE